LRRLPEEHDAEFKAYRKAHYNKEEATARARRHYRASQANRDKVQAAHKRRYAKKRGAAGSHTEAEWKQLCAAFGHRCVCCGEAKKLTRDHVIPLHRGGSNYISNIQPLCRSCNSAKWTQSTDFRRKEVSR
jgi:5-methylcytosine-specific restriction endonuclease McrA